MDQIWAPVVTNVADVATAQNGYCMPVPRRAVTLRHDGLLQRLVVRV
jgi:hypothetical protein